MTRTELVNLDAGAECVPGMYQHLADSTGRPENELKAKDVSLSK